MNSPDFTAPAWMDARVEAYVDGALAPGERAAFEARLHAAPRWQTAVRRARRVQGGLQTLPQPPACPAECPPAVTQAVLRRTTRVPHTPRPDRTAKRRAEHRAKPRAWQPALALALLLLLAAAAALLGQPAARPAEAFTHAEVQRATAEAEWTLAFLAETTREASATVREDIFRDRVTRPTRQAALRAFRHVPSAPLSPTPQDR